MSTPNETAEPVGVTAREALERLVTYIFEYSGLDRGQIGFSSAFSGSVMWLGSNPFALLFSITHAQELLKQ